MIVRLPEDVERSLEAAVQSGRFASVDDALAVAWRAFQQQPQGPPHALGLGSIGAMRDAADELDEIVAEAMARRREEARRDLAVESGDPLTLRNRRT